MSALQNLIRLGLVSVVSAEKMAVRVVFEDKDNLVTNWLPVIVSQSVGNKEYILPRVGETVVCLFLGNGIESGYCLGSIYTDEDKPPVNNANKRGVWFEDGSIVEFDKLTGTFTIDAKGDVKIKAATGVYIEGNLTVSGTITQGGGSG